MKRITKLEELSEAIERIKNQKKVDSSAINNLKHELDEEEKISRNYLQITQNGIFSKNIKKAIRWNKKVIDLKHELNTILK
ncbi:MAG: hypothetical protein K940chlam5_00573 [Candidatus Anoxychlamydiales bacterium]|nr:hypothetical protein [Candidatus Anoxychlamydiales bacterium]